MNGNLEFSEKPEPKSANPGIDLNDYIMAEFSCKDEEGNIGYATLLFISNSHAPSSAVNVKMATYVYGKTQTPFTMPVDQFTKYFTPANCGEKLHSGSKYIRNITCLKTGMQIKVDVYSVLHAFNVVSQPIAHAAKKLLCAGIRNKGSYNQDLSESIDAIKRAIEIGE